MFNKRNNSGSNAGGRTDKTNFNSSSFQRHSASNNAYHNFVNNPALAHGATGLVAGSSQAAQQQQRLLQITKNELEVQQMASNIKESLLIKRRLESIQHLQHQEANKIRAELHMKTVSQPVNANGNGGRHITSTGRLSHGLVSSSAKSIPSTSNSSVLPTKQREDEMTKIDLSTLAEVAVASATNANNANGRSSSDIMGIENMIKMNSNNNTGNKQIGALLGRQASSSASFKKGLAATRSLISQSMPTITNSMSNNAMTDALRRDINATRDKLHLEHNYKRSIDEMTKSSSSSWLWNFTNLGNRNPISMEQLRAQHEQLQRRNSLPAPASAASSELSSLRSLKRQRLLGQNANEIGEFEIQDAMKQIRQIDSKMKMQMTCNRSLLAEMMASKISQERRASIASSIASVGTSATAPNLTTNSSLSTPVNRRNSIMLDSNFDENSKVLNKLSSMGGGFPMPKFLKKASNAAESINTAFGGFKSKIPAEITPEFGKDVVDITGRETSSLSRKQQLENDQQSRYLERIGGFPMPPLYRHNDENHLNSSSNNDTIMMVRDKYDGSVNIIESGNRSNNAISSHIRNSVNRSDTKASRPPTLESYKRVWRDIRVVAGDDPRVDERLRKEVFARKLQRGEILVGKVGNSIMNNTNNRNVNSYVQQRRLSEFSHGIVSGNTSNTGGRTNCGTTNEETIVI